MSENEQVSESKMFEYIQALLKDVSDEEKKNILNAVIYTARADRKVSIKEKEFIQQAAHFLGLKSDYDIIIKEYNKSGVKRPIQTWKILAIGLTVTILMSLVISFYIQSNRQKVNVYDEQSVAFSEITFNRFVIYKNKYESGSDYFKKQAVFYLRGTGEVSFNPDNIKYNNITKTITYSYSKSPFQITTNFSQSLLVDKLDPKPIDKKTKKEIAAGVGIATAVVGGKAGGIIGHLLPPPFSYLATGVGAISSGGAGYWITSKALEGLKISKIISKEEEGLVINASKVLIKSLLTMDEKLNIIYRKKFEDYITTRYARYGFSVTSFQYEKVK